MRISNLDSVRGIAAFIVVLNHFWNNIPGFSQDFWIVQYTPFQHLIGGRQAVLLFFVLSGFVLTLPFLKEVKHTYTAYVIRRFCRIYLPYFCMTLIAAALYMLFAAPNLGAEVASGDWKNVQLFAGLPQHFAMTGLDESIRLNPPGWSLIFEMRISLLIPLLVVLVGRLSWLSLGAGVIAGVVAAKLFNHFDGAETFYAAETALGTLLLTLYYVQFFIIGIFIARNMERLKRLMLLVPRFVHMAIWAAIIFVPFKVVKFSFTISELYYAGVAAYIILCCISFPFAQRILGFAPFHWLGRVSYSLYLVHTPILLAFIYGMNGLPAGPALWGVLLAILAVVLVAAEIFCRFIELPSARLGKTLTTHMLRSKTAD